VCEAAAVVQNRNNDKQVKQCTAEDKKQCRGKHLHQLNCIQLSLEAVWQQLADVNH